MKFLASTHFFRYRLLLPTLLCALLTLLIVLARGIGSMATGDLLVYRLGRFGEPATLMLYDPQRRLSAAIDRSLRGTLYNFTVSINGQLAFSAPQDSTTDLYLLGDMLANDVPRNISQSASMNEIQLAWSPDGRYLAFGSYDEENALLYVWDGQTLIDVTPDDAEALVSNYYVAWSADGRLAFTIVYIVSSLEDDLSEIYLWDGQNTVRLSQNPTGEDRDPVWSSDGRLAFSSARGDGYTVLVWDGLGVPDRSTYLQVAPETSFYSVNPNWMADGWLVLRSFDDSYAWDGQMLFSVNQDPALRDQIAPRSIDGWRLLVDVAGGTFQVLDATQRILLMGEGQAGFMWSADGDLFWCQHTRNGWRLMHWDGEEVIVVTELPLLVAQLQSGASLRCSTG